jgi:hypothetical protein
LTSAGLLSEVLEVFLESGLPDCAAAFVDACQHAGLPVGANRQENQSQRDGQDSDNYFESSSDETLVGDDFGEAVLNTKLDWRSNGAHNGREVLNNLVSSSKLRFEQYIIDIFHHLN